MAKRTKESPAPGGMLDGLLGAASRPLTVPLWMPAALVGGLAVGGVWYWIRRRRAAAAAPPKGAAGLRGPEVVPVNADPCVVEGEMWKARTLKGPPSVAVSIVGVKEEKPGAAKLSMKINNPSGRPVAAYARVTEFWRSEQAGIWERYDHPGKRMLVTPGVTTAACPVVNRTPGAQYAVALLAAEKVGKDYRPLANALAFDCAKA